ncbi:hypothetical protein [Catellatospora tritici]|uniref:hypothetical protein n=1 Tax=Catellatospora tritici TaxID=2851566 RepID=UPI001C2D31A2|nr:hypothetical protein [Catellatospora tritici]MBV1856267.1 hypothetical protein [Catellatospora tritici]
MRVAEGPTAEVQQLGNQAGLLAERQQQVHDYLAAFARLAARGDIPRWRHERRAAGPSACRPVDFGW